ncbi:MAG: hypothetical protein EA425_02945 [Puniceicoccaceae bacterium]|nr:MAG: hypothetical protein EA425_02945 [Puniceicoccaceae bacterium]
MATCVLLPLTREKSGHLTLSADLAGKTLRLILDTGAGVTAVDPGVLKSLGLSLVSRSRKSGGVGSSTMNLTRVREHDLRLGGLDLSGIRLMALDFTHVNEALAREKVARIDGVLGADVLWKLHAQIDYRRQCLLLLS